MNRTSLIIIGAAVVFALLVGFIWFMFFRSAHPLPTNNGNFGSGSDRTPSTSVGNDDNTNVPSSIPDANGTTGAGTGRVNAGAYIIPTSTTGFASVPGVDWLGGSGNGALGGGPTSSFVPKTINDLNSDNVYGTPTLFPKDNTDKNDNDFLSTALIGAGLAGAVACTPGLLGGVAAGGAISGSVGAVGAAAAVPVNDVALNLQTTYGNTLKSNDTYRENFLDCITRVMAKVALQQITASVVNWINSGFNGQPSFVTNYRQFFTNVADQAAGEFIRSSSLSFLCSPFQNQIRTAIAQSYARRNSPSCSLSGIIGNLSSFTKGNFGQGGWQGLMSYLGVPTNNPFGAYQYGQAGLASAQSQALSQAQQEYTVGQGFLPYNKPVNCRPDPYQPQHKICDTVTATPGSTIAASLNKTLGVSQDSLNLAKSFDEVISALITQLMTKTLQGGLSSLSGEQGYASNFLTPQQQEAQDSARSLMTELQSKITIAQQYGAVAQGSITDIQTTQRQLQTLANCWESASSTPDLPTGKQQQAQANGINTLAALHSYDTQVDIYNANITKANASISRLQELQTQTLGVGSVKDVANVKAAYQSDLAAGRFVNEADVTTAQQNRTTLQGSLTLRNNQTATELQQCHAF